MATKAWSTLVTSHSCSAPSSTLCASGQLFLGRWLEVMATGPVVLLGLTVQLPFPVSESQPSLSWIQGPAKALPSHPVFPAPFTESVSRRVCSPDMGERGTSTHKKAGTESVYLSAMLLIASLSQTPDSHPHFGPHPHRQSLWTVSAVAHATLLSYLLWSRRPFCRASFAPEPRHRRPACAHALLSSPRPLFLL